MCSTFMDKYPFPWMFELQHPTVPFKAQRKIMQHQHPTEDDGSFFSIELILFCFLVFVYGIMTIVAFNPT